jgi:hypothetical protein
MLYVSDQGTHALSESGIEMAAMIRDALPNSNSSPDRRHHIMHGLLIEEITMPRLLAMVRIDVIVLDSASKTHDTRVQMLTGERFDIIETISAMASGKASAARGAEL